MEIRLFATAAEAIGSRRIDYATAPDETVADVLESVCASHPGLEATVFADDELRPSVNLLLDGQEVRSHPDGLSALAEPIEELAIVPVVSGG